MPPLMWDYYDDTIINTDNNIIYNEECNEFFSLILDNSFIKLKKLIRGGIKWSLHEIEVDIT